MRDSYAVGRAVVALGGAALCLMTAAGGPAFAQRGGARPTAAERRQERMTRQGEQYERDKLMRDLKGGEPLDPEARRHAEAVASKIRHDLEGLQKGYNRIVLATASKDGLKTQSISGAVADIKKCAGRLKTSLALPRPKEDEGEEARAGSTPARAEEPLPSLLKHIYSFITNPLFEAPSVLDMEQAKKASRDLDRIIALSEALGKSLDRAKKH